MADKDYILTETENQTLRKLAQRRGYTSPRQYLISLLARDAEQHGEAPPIEEDDELGDPVEGFRQAWGEAMRGELLTEEEFWKAVAEDE